MDGKKDEADPVDVVPLGVEQVLEEVGAFDRFQWMLIVLFSVINSLSAFHYFGQTFLGVEPDHECTTDSFENETIVGVDNCTVMLLRGNETVQKGCKEWTYNSSYGYVSLVQDLNWICNDDWKAMVGQSVFFGGSLIGSLAFGVLADRIGRLHVLVLSNSLAFIGNIVTIFCFDVTTYSLARFLAGCATDSNFVMMYMIVMEYMKPSMRTFGLNITIGIFYCISSMAVPWVAVAMGHWQYFLVAIAVPHLLVLLYYIKVPESAEWLISRNRVDEAIAAFERIAKFNKKTLSKKTVVRLKAYATQNIKPTNRNASFLNLLKTPKLRRKTLILILKSMILNLCYDAIARNVNGLGFSPFIIFSATSATILPGCLVVILLQDRIGRKALASGSLLLGGIFICIVGILLATIQSYDPLFNLILTIIARLNVIVAFNSGSQYAFELIPTEVRAQGVSVIHVAGFASAFFSPQILYLDRFWKPLPDIVLGALLTIAAIACLFLPETLNKTLPVTLEEGEEFGENEGVFEFACCKRIVTESTIVLNNS